MKTYSVAQYHYTKKGVLSIYTLLTLPTVIGMLACQPVSDWVCATNPRCWIQVPDNVIHHILPDDLIKIKGGIQ